MTELTEAITEASIEGNAARVQDLGDAYNQAEADLQTVMEEWELLAE